NTLCTLEMLANTYWSDRQSHFLMQSTPELRACQQATEALMIQLALMLKSGELKGAEQAISELQEAATRVRLDTGGEAAISGYLWLSLQLTEQLTHLRRLLGLVLHPPRSQS
ncbi:FUSC family protein, partial [Klebsiella pneumoniae]